MLDSLAQAPHLNTVLIMTPAPSKETKKKDGGNKIGKLFKRRTGTETCKHSKNGFGEVIPVGDYFKPEEERILIDAVEKYCKAEQITPEELLLKNNKKKGAWNEIAKALPGRTTMAVYRRTWRQFHPFRRGPWSDEECDMLIRLVGLHGRNYASIQSKLNRSKDDIQDKYREIQADYNKGKWPDEEIDRMRLIVCDLLDEEADTEWSTLSKKAEKEGVLLPWSVVSKKLSTRSRLACLSRWYCLTGKTQKGVQQFKPLRPCRNGPARSYLVTESDLESKILTQIIDSGVKRESEFEWAHTRIANAQNRWISMVDQYEKDVMPGDPVLGGPICKLAKLILDHRHQVEAQARKVEAAELVKSAAL